jgi:hypothetical protein
MHFMKTGLVGFACCGFSCTESRPRGFALAESGAPLTSLDGLREESKTPLTSFDCPRAESRAPLISDGCPRAESRAPFGFLRVAYFA